MRTKRAERVETEVKEVKETEGEIDCWYCHSEQTMMPVTFGIQRHWKCVECGATATNKQK